MSHGQKSHGFSQPFTAFFSPPVVYDATALRPTRILARAVTTLTLLLVLAACGLGKAPLTEEEKASLVAKECYEGLYINGHPETFLNGRIDIQQMPQSFRQQLLDGYRQHLGQVESQRQGVRGIEVVDAVSDSTLNLVQVFLSLKYGNGTQEEIVVPMVQANDGSWHMK